MLQYFHFGPAVKISLASAEDRERDRKIDRLFLRLLLSLVCPAHLEGGGGSKREKHGRLDRLNPRDSNPTQPDFFFHCAVSSGLGFAFQNL